MTYCGQITQTAPDFLAVVSSDNLQALELVRVIQEFCAMNTKAFGSLLTDSHAIHPNNRHRGQHPAEPRPHY